VKGSPKREGTTAHLKFSLYRDGMTVMKFQEQAKKYKELKGRLSLKYDMDHELIAVEPKNAKTQTALAPAAHNAEGASRKKAPAKSDSL